MNVKKALILCILTGCLFIGIVSAENVSESNEIFLQEGSSGTFVMDESGNYTLTIHKIIPYTIYFTDRPLKDAGFVPLDLFISGFNWSEGNPPNAAIMLREADDIEDTIIGQLKSPQYDSVNQTLTYTVSVLSEYKSNTDSTWMKELKGDDSIPETFEKVILAIDGCPCVLNYNSCGPGGGEDYPWHEYCNSMKFKWYKVNCDWDGLCCSTCYV